MCISVQGDDITIEMECSSRKEVITFKLGEPYEIRAGKPSKVGFVGLASNVCFTRNPRTITTSPYVIYIDSSRL